MPIVGHTFFAGDGRSWNLDTMVRTNPDGSQHPASEWSAAEAVSVQQWRTVAFRTDRIELIRSEIGVLRARAAMVDADADAAAGLMTVLADRAAAIRATPLANITPTVIREEIAKTCDRDVATLAWRQDVDSLLAKLCIDVAWLGQLVGRFTEDPP